MYAVNINSQEKTYFEAHRKYLETKATDEYEMARLKQAVADRDQALADKDQTIAYMERRIAELESMVSKPDDQ